MSGVVYQTPADLVASLRTTADTVRRICDEPGNGDVLAAWQLLGRCEARMRQAADMLERMTGLADPSGTKGITLVSYPKESALRIIKTIRSAMGISLTQAMQASERLPFAIHFLSPHGGTTWDDLASDLRAIGAVIMVNT